MLTEMPLRSMRDRFLLIRSLPTFAGLDEDALTLLVEHARSRTFRAGETVVAEGEPLRAAHIVIEGQITSKRKGKLLAVVTRGRGVGMLSIMARDPAGVHAVADVDTLTLTIPSDVMLDAIETNFAVARNTLRLCASSLVKKRGHLPAPPDRPPPFSMGEYHARPRTMVELLIDLRANPGILADCNIDALISVARSVEEIRVEPGHLFWKIGEPSSHWLRVSYGRVRCTSADGKAVDVGSRFVLGVMDALGNEPRSYEARAETNVIAFQTQLESFLSLLENHFDLARDFIAMLAMAVLETPG